MGCSQASPCQCDDNDRDENGKERVTCRVRIEFRSMHVDGLVLFVRQDSFAQAFAKRSKTMASFRVASFEDLSLLSEGVNDEAMEFVRHFYQEAVVNSTHTGHLVQPACWKRFLTPK